MTIQEIEQQLLLDSANGDHASVREILSSLTIEDTEYFQVHKDTMSQVLLNLLNSPILGIATEWNTDSIQVLGAISHVFNLGLWTIPAVERPYPNSYLNQDIILSAFPDLIYQQYSPTIGKDLLNMALSAFEYDPISYNQLNMDIVGNMLSSFAASTQQGALPGGFDLVNTILRYIDSNEIVDVNEDHPQLFSLLAHAPDANTAAGAYAMGTLV